MEYRLDETDRQLLRLLQTNARASTAHLARQMNLARTTVVARIARLEQEGVIAGYGVRLGARVEQSAVRAYCGIRVQPKTATAVMQALNRSPKSRKSRPSAASTTTWCSCAAKATKSSMRCWIA
jgi:DNA-binding Lrp family transcriptional regulator